MRLACVYVPQLALQAALRRNPDARDEPAALLETAGPGKIASSVGRLRRPELIAGGAEPSQGSAVKKPRVTQLESRARRAGVRPA